MTDDVSTATKKIIQAPHSHFLSINDIDESSLSVVNFSETLLFVDGAATPSSIMTQMSIEWNEQSLLVFFRGRFENLRYETNPLPETLQKKTRRLWELSDVYEVFIGPKATERRMYKEFQVAPDGRWFDSDVFHALGMSNHNWYSGFKAKSFVDKEMGIWSTVFELPWNCFGASYDNENEWNVNFFRASGKFHGDELLAWAAPGTGEKCFHRPQHFGKIHFEF